MKILEKIKSDNASTMTDVTVGILILIIFTGILTSSFYNIYKHNISIRMDAIANDYAIKILEDIDRMKYDEVSNELNNVLVEKYSIDQKYNATLEIKNYNEEDNTKEDIIKIVKLTIKYKLNDEDKVYTIEKLKIKER